MNKNNKVIRLGLSCNKIGDDGVSALSMALMNENNKVTSLELLRNNFGDHGARSLSTALMNVNNKLTILWLNSNKIGTQSLAMWIKGCRISLVNCLENSKSGRTPSKTRKTARRICQRFW